MLFLFRTARASLGFTSSITGNSSSALGLLVRVVFRANEGRVEGTDAVSLNDGFSLAESKMRNIFRHDKKGPRRELLRCGEIKPFAETHHPCAGEDGYRFIKRMPMRWHLRAVSVSYANDVWGA